MEPERFNVCPNSPARGGNCHPGQLLLVSSLPARMGERIAADCSGPRPNNYRTLITVSAREAEACILCSQGAWLLPVAAKISARELLVASETPHLPQLSQCLVLGMDTSGSTDGWQGHCCEVDNISWALPAAFLYRYLPAGASLVKDNNQVKSRGPRYPRCAL